MTGDGISSTTLRDNGYITPLAMHIGGRSGSEATLPTSLVAPHCPRRFTARLTPHWYHRDPNSRSIPSVKHLEDTAILAIAPVSGPGTFVR
jgi:hypothetical protein